MRARRIIEGVSPRQLVYFSVVNIAGNHDEDVEERQARLSLGNANDVDVYIGLDTRWKNVTAREGERYFSLILDAIFKTILETN